jgi:ABC-type multidrug transport system fused ATPase/permease subunit
MNLDSFNEHSDSSLWEALEKAHAARLIAGLPGGLDFCVSEGGENFSAGQRQLLCLARLALFIVCANEMYIAGLCNIVYLHCVLVIFILIYFRALIRKSKILIIDEATSSMDYETDQLIQATIREEFGGGRCTVLTIAHRVDSITDSDRVLVMTGGRVGEIDSPVVLMKNKSSLFAQLITSENYDNK